MPAALVGCSADQPLNPSFPLTVADAHAALTDMAKDPKPVERPIVIALGWLDPGFPSGLRMGMQLNQVLRQRSADEPMFLCINFVGCSTFDACRHRLINLVNEQWPSDDSEWTVDVDVIAVSMGGLVARHAASPPTKGGRRLRIRRLFTISSPYRGAAMAAAPTLDSRVADMRPGSNWLERLDRALMDADYEIIPYVRLGDAIVGQDHAAPVGQRAWWVANMPLHGAHLAAASDSRILADILRRLRGEPPFTISPPAPLPRSASDSPSDAFDARASGVAAGL